MMVRLRTALISAAVALVLIVPAAFAYNGEVGAVVDVSGPGQAVCPATGQTYTATVTDTNGNPLEGVTVTWSTGAVGTTDAQGHHSITVDVTTSTTITATVQGASGSITVTCIGAGAVGGSISLPRTDSARSSGAALPVLLIIALGLALPGALLYRRRAR
jgi:hypothetical protein